MEHAAARTFAVPPAATLPPDPPSENQELVEAGAGAPLDARVVSAGGGQTAAAAAATDANAAYASSPDIDHLMTALALAQLAFGHIERNQEATVAPKDTSRRAYTYAYADLASILDVVRPLLNEQGIAFMQFPTTRTRTVRVTTLIAHGGSGQWIRAHLEVGISSLDPQIIGSAISYARRYSALAMLGVAPSSAEDDDGAAAGLNSRPPAKAAAPSSAAVPMPARRPPPAPAAQVQAPARLIEADSRVVAAPVYVAKLDPRTRESDKRDWWMLTLSDGRELVVSDQVTATRLTAVGELTQQLRNVKTTRRGAFEFFGGADVAHGDGSSAGVRIVAQ